MNNLEKTIQDSISFWKQYERKENGRPMIYNDDYMAKYITEKLLTQDAEFKFALYQIVTEKLEGRL
jgi:DNA-binding GntR family transcriptional regulator